MVPLVTDAMDRSEAYRRTITGTFDHLLVDEYQDVKPARSAPPRNGGSSPSSGHPPK
jgi:hypothetical protein